jgi:hypothetical protein
MSSNRILALQRKVMMNFECWILDDFFWFPVSALRFQVSSLATSYQLHVTAAFPSSRRSRASAQLGGLVTP